MATHPAHVVKELSFDGVIKKGDRNQRVRRVQEWLKINGFATAIDSDFGDATERCVINFQRARGIAETGKVNQETWEALVEKLNKALAPIEFPASVKLSDAILRVARQHLAQHPIEVGGDNAGPWVRVYMDGNQGSAWRWCAGFITFVMKQACRQLTRPLPIPGSYSCDSLFYQAKEAGLLVRGTQIENNSVSWSAMGSAQIFLVRRSATDWVHTGLCFDGANTVFSTIEGNTNEEGGPNGFEVVKRVRSIPSKDFIKFPV